MTPTEFEGSQEPLLMFKNRVFSKMVAILFSETGFIPMQSLCELEKINPVPEIHSNRSNLICHSNALPVPFFPEYPNLVT